MAENISTRKLTREEFASQIRQKHPDKWMGFDDDKMVDRVLTIYPWYKDKVKPPGSVPDPKSPPTAKVNGNVPYDPTMDDHLNYTWHGIKTMGLQIPQSTLGFVGSMLEEDSELRDNLINWSTCFDVQNIEQRVAI